MSKLLFFFSMLLIASCGNVIDKKFDNTINDLKSENAKLQEQYMASYADYMKQTTDTSKRKQAENVYRKCFQTTSLIDSLSNLLGGLDSKDPENLSRVNQLLTGGISGRILNTYLSAYFKETKELVKDDTQKVQTIDSIRNYIFGGSENQDVWQRHLFEQQTPFGATALMEGIKQEMYGVGKLAFRK